jgi:MFS family permease
VTANFLVVAARMSLVTFLGIYFVRKAGIDLATVGIALLLENVLRGVLAPLFGALSDRIGRRTLLIAAALVTAAVLPCFLLVTGPASLVAWSLAMGVAGAVNMPVASALLLDLSSAERRQGVLALNYTAMSVAYTLGVMPAGFVAEQGYGLLALMSTTGFLLVAALYAVALRADPPAEHAAATGSFFTHTLSALRDRVFLAFAVLGFVFPLAMGLVVIVSPLYAADRGLGEGYIGLVLGGNSLIVAALAVPVATRIEPMGPFRLLGASALLVAAGLACYGAIPSPGVALLAGTVIFSFGELVFSSAVPAAVARLAPPGRRGAYQGGWALVGSLSMGSALAVSAPLREAYGWDGTWLAFAALTLAGGLGLLATRAWFLRASK